MTSMKNLTVSLGALLIILGLASYFGTGSKSFTAMIPAFFGLVFVILGFLSALENIKKHMMHASVGFALLGFIGAARGIPGFFEILTGGEVERPVAIYAQIAMLLMCLTYIIAAVKSFRAARKASSE